MNTIRLLIATDDLPMRQQFAEALSTAGYRVHACSPDNAMHQISLKAPDLIILDNSCDMDNLLTRQIRSLSDIPIIVVSSHPSENDILAAFDAGGDDFLLKPIRMKELSVRIGAILRRCKGPGRLAQKTQYICGDLVIDLHTRKVIVGDKEVYLTATEFNLLSHLAYHANQICLHEQMLSAVWGEPYRNDHDYLRSYVHNLRKKLERNPTQPELIVTIQGVGYMLVDANVERRERL